MKKNKFVVANWKMNMSLENTRQWLHGIENKVFTEDVEVVISPSDLHILDVYEFSKEKNIHLCAQDVSVYAKGAHTGDTGAFQIVELCKYCIIGHSERAESSDTVLKKRDMCLKNNITPIVCFIEVPLAGHYYVDGIILVWEDPENISKEGVYKPKAPREVQKAVDSIKASLTEDALLLYGGSVNKDNIDDLVNIDRLDGVLVGNASIDPEHFLKIVSAYEVYKHEE